MTKKQSLPTWDLTHFYLSKKARKVKNDIIDATERAKRLQKIFEGQVVELEADVLAAGIEEYEQIQEILGKLGSYAYLLYSEDVTNQENAKFYQDISEKINEISVCLIFFHLEINKIDEDKLQNDIKSSAKLRHYAPWLRDVRAFKNYQLSDEVEKILHEKHLTSSQSWHRLFDETIAGLVFPFGEEELSSAEIFDKLSSKKSDERKKAAKSIGEVFGKNIKTFAHITNTLAKDKEIDDRWRGFAKPISSRNLSNFVEDKVTEALIETVKENYKKTSHRYYKIKAKMLGKTKLEYWDRNAPLPGRTEDYIEWLEAMDIVLHAYADFSVEMAEIGKRFFNERWIDAGVRKGKDSGAYSHPTVPSLHPYILMNYQGKIRDVMTLAHELGHGVHQVLSAPNGHLMADTPLTLAETASVFGEQLTFRALLAREKSEKNKKLMIAGKVEDMLNTVVRQVAFCEFEKGVHDARKNGELTPDEIGKIWMKVQKESLGSAFNFHDDYQYYWSYIPHFVHTPFYVYAYAFGDCLVNSLYKVYEKQPKGFADKYLDMLRAGGTLRHKELLAPFGLDASRPTFWQNGIDMLIEFIDELE